MAETTEKKNNLGQQIFRDTALRKMSSADDLDHYLKVTSPSAWVLVGAVTVLLVAAFIWASTASLPITTTTIGVIKDHEIVCFMPLGDNPYATTTVASLDSKVAVSDNETKIVSIDSNPYSKREVAEALEHDYVLDSLYATEWNYKLIIEAPEILFETGWKEGDDVPIQITTREVAPFVYLFGGAQS